MTACFPVLQFAVELVHVLCCTGCTRRWNADIQTKATEQYFPVVLFIVFYRPGVLHFSVCGWNPKVQPFKWKLLSSTFLWCCLLCFTGQVFFTFWSVDEILKSNHSNESCGTVHCVVHSGSHFWVYGWNPKVWQLKWALLKIMDIEDLTCVCVDTNFTFECLTRYLSISCNIHTRKTSSSLLRTWLIRRTTIQMKAIEQYFPTVPYNVVLTFESVGLTAQTKAIEHYFYVLLFANE